MQISPQKAFPITWVSSVPGDSDTHYVQAVVRNSLTMATLTTVNLTDQSGGIFSKSYTTPADPSITGTGYYIIITITVYTDSGYATKDQNFAVITNEYLVKTLVDPQTFLGGGGGVLDYREIKKVVKEVLDEAEVVEPEPPVVVSPQINPLPMIEELKGAIQALSDKVSAIRIPEPPVIPETPPVDLSPLNSSFRMGIENVLRKIKVIPSAPDYSVQLSEIKSAFSGLSRFNDLEKQIEENKTSLVQCINSLEELAKKIDAILGLQGIKASGGISLTLNSPSEPRRRLAYKA